jgi:hypothetical protein
MWMCGGVGWRCFGGAGVRTEALASVLGCARSQ